jgi:hypothetical protein
MKGAIYFLAAAWSATATYQSAATTEFSWEGIALWTAAVLIGGLAWGFVGNWAYDEWKRQR